VRERERWSEGSRERGRERKKERDSHRREGTTEEEKERSSIEQCMKFDIHLLQISIII